MSLNDRQLPLMSIGTVEKLTGLTARQIRYYEQHNLIAPIRSDGKQRLFSVMDVTRLLKIRELMQLGLRVDRIKEKLSPIGFKEEPQSPSPATGDNHHEIHEELLNSDPTTWTSSIFRGELARFSRRK